MPQHRKPTHGPKVLAAAMGVAATISGVAFAQVGQEQLRTAPEPATTASSPAAPSLSASDVDEGADLRDLRPSRSASTRRADLKEKAGKQRSAEKDRRPQTSPSPTETSTPAPPPPEAEPTPEPEPTVGSQATAPTTKAPPGGGILGGTNSARADAGLPALGVSSCLGRMAQRHAERLAAAGNLYHQELGAVMSACGMSTAGENVAMNYTRPSDMVGQWLDSPGHRANMLNRGFSLIGVGVAQARDGAWYGVQVFGAR